MYNIKNPTFFQDFNAFSLNFLCRIIVKLICVMVKYQQIIKIEVFL